MPVSRSPRSHRNTLILLALLLCAIAVGFAFIASTKLDPGDWLACLGAVFALVGTVLTAIGVIVDPEERAGLKRAAEHAKAAAKQLEERAPSVAVAAIARVVSSDGDAQTGSSESFVRRLDVLERCVAELEHVVSDVENALIKASDYGRFGLVFLACGTVTALIGLGWPIISKNLGIHRQRETACSSNQSSAHTATVISARTRSASCAVSLTPNKGL